MDTVYNDVSNGPFIQTFKFLDYGFLFGMYHNAKDAEAMLQGVNVLETILGTELFLKCVEVLKTDNGPEFVNNQVETKEETIFEKTLKLLGIKHRRTRPYSPWQNGKVEKNHRIDGERFYLKNEFTSVEELKTKNKR